QTLEELVKDFEPAPAPSTGTANGNGSDPPHPNGSPAVVFLKAIVNGKIIGSVRGYSQGETAYLPPVVGHPNFRRRWIRRRLLDEIERQSPGVARFEAKPGHQSKRTLHQLNKRGYEVFKTEPFTPRITWVYLQKKRHPPKNGNPAACELT